MENKIIRCGIISKIDFDGIFAFIIAIITIIGAKYVYDYDYTIEGQILLVYICYIFLKITRIK